MAHYVFDVNETLADLSGVERSLRASGAPAGLAATWFASVLRDGFALSVHRAAPAFADLGRELLVRSLVWVDLDTTVGEAVDDAMAALGDLDLHPDVAPALTALAEAGHVLSTFTNGAADHTRRLLDRAGLLPLVHRTLSVEGLGVWKPHPDAYAHAASALGARPETLVLVAVHPWDVDGAARAGFGTVLVDRRDGPPPGPAFRTPDHRVRGLVELAGLP